MNVRNFRTSPIVLATLAHTGLTNGNDGASEGEGENKVVSKLGVGYRQWPMRENNDPLVVVDPCQVRQELVYAVGPVRGLCPYYPGGLGAENVAIVRKPVLDGLLALNAMLKDIGLGVVLVDGWRDGQIQVNLWRYLFNQAAKKEGLTRESMSVADIVRLGDDADNIGSYNAVVEDDKFSSAVEMLLDHDLGTQRDGNGQIAILASQLNTTVEEVAAKVITYEANLGWRDDVELSKTANTAHGGAAATDIYLYVLDTGEILCPGVPFDYPGKASQMDYFENPANYAEFLAEVERDPMLRQYLAECGFENVTANSCLLFRDNRRVLFHAVTSLGATIYWKEPWHVNWPCNHGEFPKSGNGCQALLMNEPVGVWTNEFGNEEAHRILADIAA